MSLSDKERNLPGKHSKAAPVAGWAGWFLTRIQSWVECRVQCRVQSRVQFGSRPGPSLSLVQRITLAPRQTLALVEADGRRLLVATSPDGAPAFYALDDRPNRRSASALTSPARVSW